MKKSDPLAVTPAKIARAHRWELGTPVTLTRDNGDVIQTKTRTSPWNAGGTWVIMVDGVSGCYALARVHDAEETRSRAVTEEKLF